MSHHLLYYWTKAKFLICLTKRAKAEKLFFQETGYRLTDACYQQTPEIFDHICEEFYAEPEYSVWQNPHSEISLDEIVDYKNAKDDNDPAELEPVVKHTEIIKTMVHIAHKEHLKLVD